jgi:hypothetical protein
LTPFEAEEILKFSTLGWGGGGERGGRLVNMDNNSTLERGIGPTLYTGKFSKNFHKKLEKNSKIYIFLFLKIHLHSKKSPPKKLSYNNKFCQKKKYLII